MTSPEEDRGKRFTVALSVVSFLRVRNRNFKKIVALSLLNNAFEQYPVLVLIKAFIKTTERNRFELKNDLRCALSEIFSQIDKLCENKQC